jgi:hypothetical protein
LNKGKLAPAALQPPNLEERKDYLAVLRDSLDGFISSDRGLRHSIEVLVDRELAVFSVFLERSDVAINPVFHKATEKASQGLKFIRDRLRQKHSQWIYFDRALKVYEGGILYQFKPMQRLHWTRRQAVLDADDIIAETLVEGGIS